MSLVSLSQVCIVITSPLAVSICSGTTTTAGLGRLCISSTTLLVGASGIVVGVVGTGTTLLVVVGVVGATGVGVGVDSGVGVGASTRVGVGAGSRVGGDVGVIGVGPPAVEVDTRRLV